MDDPDILAVAPDLLNAVSKLDDAFSHSRDSSLPTDETSRACNAQETCPLTSNLEVTEPRAPALPPVLDDQLERAVFTHPACGNNNNATYDRLEILGDAYIELIATRMIWEKFPGISSGRISQIRELLVKNETLAAFTEIYGFDRRATVPAKFSDQPKRWVKTKGDIFEAYVAAVILSRPAHGYEVAERWLAQLWMPKLDQLGHQKADLRCKEALAKKVMGKGIKLEYIEERPIIQHIGSGTQTFFIGVYLTGWGWEKRHLGSGQGSSKVAAGDEAARNALLDTSLISEVTAAKETSNKGK